MKVSAYGDITITIVNEPFSIHLSNEAQQFPTDEKFQKTYHIIPM